MKNVFLTLAFMLIGTFGFASNNLDNSNCLVEKNIELPCINSIEYVKKGVLLKTDDILSAPGDLWIFCAYIGNGWWYCEVYEEI